VDDFYVKGKSRYKERHFKHDGLIYGVDNQSKEYLIAAYDKRWIYRNFRTPQRCFIAGIRASLDRQEYGHLMGLKCLPDKIELNVPMIKAELLAYLDAPLNKGDEMVFGISAVRCLLDYLNFIKNGFIPFEKIDNRVFRLLWEHKKCMADRITAVEAHCGLSDDIGVGYAPLVGLADNIRFIYMKYCMKQDDALLEIIKIRLKELLDAESRLLRALCEKI
jgi:hypothetical protein